MKKTVVFLGLLIAFNTLVFAGTEKVENDTTNKQILSELQIIRGLQQKSDERREKAVKDKLVRDSLQHIKSEEDLSTDYSVMAKIEDNTRQDPVKDGWNLYGWIAFVVAAFSAIIALITFRAQSKTEQHTKNAPLSAQIGRFKDLTRHLYRNLVCTSAAIAKYNSRNNFEPVTPVSAADKKGKTKQKDAPGIQEVVLARLSYPSESNFDKLKTMPDDVILNIDINERTYTQMHELKVLLRNYNIEIDVASNHVSNKQIWDEALKQDFDNLIFKPLHLIKSAFESEELMLSTDSGKYPLPDRSVYIILEEHFKKLRSNFKALGYTDAFEVLKEFFGAETGAQMEEPEKEWIPQIMGHFISTVDATMALNRALTGFINEAILFDSALLDSRKETITVNRMAFCKYLDDRDDQIVKDIQARLKENTKLLNAAKRSLLWPFDLERKKEEIKLIKAAITKCENKLKTERKKYEDDDKKRLSYFVQKIAEASDLDSFKESGFIKYDASDSPHVKIEEIHKHLLKYIHYIAQENWDFRELIYVILAIDASIEVTRIGMVNYPK